MVDLFDFQRGGWDLNLLRQLFTSNPVQAICNLPNLFLLGVDRLIWTPDPQGCFSVRSVYQSLCWSDAQVFSQGVWMKLWKLKIQERLKLMLWPKKKKTLKLWKCAHEALPLRARLASLCGFPLSL